MTELDHADIRLRAADSFGPFHVVDQLGTGLLGPVLRARTQTNGLVAIKLFTCDITVERAHRLLDEFERLIHAPLNHPAIVKPVAAGLHGASPYLVCDYVNGEALQRSTLRHCEWPALQVLRLAVDLASALDFSAVVDIHHGALHSGDVLICRDAVRMTGLGIAEALQRAGVTPPNTRYSALRHANSGESRSADILALAGLVHELLFGCPLVAGNQRDRVLFRRVFDRVRSANQQDQFQTALEFAQALEHASDTGATNRPASIDRAEGQSAGSKRRSFLTRAALLALVSVFAAGIAGGYRVWNESGFEGVWPTVIKPLHRASSDETHETAIPPRPTFANPPRVEEAASATGPRGKPIPAAKASRAAPADESPSGLLYIDSQPRGATIFIDEKLMGTTPLAVVAPGEHAVRLERDGNPVWSSTVRVSAERLNRIIVDLDR